ncbi:MAG: putative metal-dependent hydrolase [Acidobacteria bacterium]|nr:putative metal-dependent hydrolase [Acidobacteriota bacterium]MCA1638218.1 putative metal-dependent hydrolase [Acidobacteriota bacterium]
MSEDLRFPLGKFEKNIEITAELRKEFVQTISQLPKNLKKAISGLSDEQLETPYRPEGWTVRQTVHHIADSHLNSFIRFKLALTEDVPTIRPYAEDRWAELADSKMPIDVSLKIIEGIHARWTALLESMSDEDFQKELNHPDSGKWTLEKMLGLYEWHSRHHTAHITKLRERNDW